MKMFGWVFVVLGIVVRNVLFVFVFGVMVVLWQWDLVNVIWCDYLVVYIFGCFIVGEIFGIQVLDEFFVVMVVQFEYLQFCSVEVGLGENYDSFIVGEVIV